MVKCSTKLAPSIFPAHYHDVLIKHFEHFDAAHSAPFSARSLRKKLRNIAQCFYCRAATNELQNGDDLQPFGNIKSTNLSL